MLIGHIDGCTRTLGVEQGYEPLPVRDAILEQDGQHYEVMTTAWVPTPEELRRLLAGGAIHVTIFGTAHPPMLVTVGD